MKDCTFDLPVHVVQLERIDPVNDHRMAFGDRAVSSKLNDAAGQEPRQSSEEEASEEEIPDYMDEGFDGEPLLGSRQPLCK